MNNPMFLDYVAAKADEAVCIYYTDQNGAMKNKLHMHLEYEIHYTLCGELRIVSGNKTVELSAPALILHRPYTMHITNTTTDCRYDRYVIYLRPDTIAELGGLVPALDEIYTSDFFARSVPPETAGRLTALCGAMNAAPDRAGRLLYLGLILREVSGFAGKIGVREKSPVSYIRGIMEYIGAHYAEPLATDSLADRFFVSRSKLNRDFVSFTGISPHEFITRVRLENSKRLLRRGCGVSDAGLECGFPNVSNFIRVFNKYFSQTPLKYARNGVPGAADGKGT